MTHRTDGTYVVQFKSSLGSFGAGVISIKNLEVTGGDSGFLFSGRLRETGPRLNGVVSVRQHLKGFPSIFGNLEAFELDLQGQFEGGKGFFHGHVVGQPSLRVSTQLDRAAQAAE